MEISNLIYNRYGSADSTDVDMIIYVDSLPETIEDRKRLATKIKQDNNLNWNIILATLINGVIVDTQYPKSSPDSLNNAVYNTYYNHTQEHPLLIERTVARNNILAIYKTVRTILTVLSRTQYRTLLRPTMNYSFGIDIKLQNLLNVDYTHIDTFKQDNTNDVDIWKIIPFYLVQNNALINDNIEIYTKQGIVDYELKAKPFINRVPLTIEDKAWLTKYLHDYIGYLQTLPITCSNEIIELNGEKANMNTKFNEHTHKR